ncbi:hypothetical protein D3C75_639170 [compost metagenome]
MNCRYRVSLPDHPQLKLIDQLFIIERHPFCIHGVSANESQHMEQKVGEVDDAVKALRACTFLLHLLLSIEIVILQNGQQGAPLAGVNHIIIAFICRRGAIRGCQQIK